MDRRAVCSRIRRCLRRKCKSTFVVVRKARWLLFAVCERIKGEKGKAAKLMTIMIIRDGREEVKGGHEIKAPFVRDYSAKRYSFTICLEKIRKVEITVVKFIANCRFV